MRPRRVFRPQVSEWLEHRVVPTVAALAPPPPPPPVLLGHVVRLPPQMPQDGQMSQLFNTFLKSYAHAVDAVLFAPGPNGTVNPAANRPAFNTAVAQALNALADGLVASLGNPALAAQVRAAITGNSPDSLESQLTAVTTSSISQGSTSQSLLSDSQQAIRLSLGRIVANDPDPSLSLVTQSDTTAAQASAFTTQAINTSLSSAQATQQVRSAFTSFLTSYFKAVRDTLLAPSANGSIDPSRNRAAFDARVDAALLSLTNNLVQVAGNHTAVSATTIGDTILGAGAGSLKSLLAGLATPAGPEAALVRELTLGSIQAIGQVLASVAGLLAYAPSSAA